MVCGVTCSGKEGTCEGLDSEDEGDRVIDRIATGDWGIGGTTNSKIGGGIAETIR
jgi:hypothetical protein